MRSIEDFRKFNNQKLPGWYSWRSHVAANLVLIFSLMISVSVFVFPLRISEMLLLPLFFFSWSLIEYLIHRFVLHGKSFSKLKFYSEHSVFHHGYFTNIHMKVTQFIDLNRVFLFTSDLFASLLVNAGFSAVVAVFVGLRTGALFFLSGILFVLAYEIIHGLCHSGIQFKNSSLQAWIAHHQDHHNPKLMNHKNFSVVFPFVDQIFNSKQGDANVQLENSSSRN